MIRVAAGADGAELHFHPPWNSSFQVCYRCVDVALKASLGKWLEIV